MSFMFVSAKVGLKVYSMIEVVIGCGTAVRTRRSGSRSVSKYFYDLS